MILRDQILLEQARAIAKNYFKLQRFCWCQLHVWLPYQKLRFLCKRDLPWRRKFDEIHDFGRFLVRARVPVGRLGSRAGNPQLRSYEFRF